MIFKHFFKPKYQHKDPQVRIQAIEQLSANEAEGKSILHELAFNDESPRVQLAALDKLDSFTLWWKLSETCKDERIKRRAFQEVEATLLDSHSNKLSAKERQSFIRECRHNALLEALVTEPVIQQELDVTLDILARLNKPHLNYKILFSTTEVALQLALLAQLEEESMLNKAAKKIESREAQEIIQQKLDALALARQKPQEISKQLSLVLSKLLALTDESDFPTLQQKREIISQQYEELHSELSWLKAEHQQEIEQKFASICQKLDKLQQQLEPEWLKQQQVLQKQQQSRDLMTRAEALLESFSSKLQALIKSVEQQQLQQLKQELRQALTELEPAEASKSKEVLVNRLHQGLSTLESLPGFQQSLEKARDLLQQFSTEVCPQQKCELEQGYQRLNEVKASWKSYRQEYMTFWPQELEQDWQQLLQSWQQQLKSLKLEVEQDIKFCRNKLRQIQNMVQQGKYHAAIGLYRKLQQQYLQLPQKQQSMLSRQYLSVQQQVENLQDWQAYIAQPRKPGLLEQIKQLAAQPLDVHQQAEKVKQLRQEWNSLGKLESEEDHILNQAFDLACEQAFVPCREFYAELEQQRAANLVLKQQLLEVLSNLEADVQENKALVKKFRQLQQQWRDIGEVDYKQHSLINRQYGQLCEPIRKKVQDFYANNAELKQKLITQAEQLLMSEDVREATDTAKELQQQWKSIEYAGKQDNNLWQQFRQVNDQLFKRKQEIDSSRREKNDELISQLQSLLEQGQEALEQATNKAEVGKSLDAVTTQVTEVLQQLPAKLARQYDSQWQQLKGKQQDKLAQQDALKQQQLYHEIFTLGEQWREDVPEATVNLPQQWKACFDTSEQEFDRLQLTVLMEILAEAESRVEDVELRQQLQLKMMASKLEQGISYSLDSLLQQWLKQGPLSDADLTLLQRVKKLFTMQ